MQNPSINVNKDMRVSPQTIAYILAGSGIFLFLVSYTPNEVNRTLLLFLLSGIIVGIAVAVYQLAERHPMLSRWLAVLTSILVFQSSGFWVGMVGTLVYLSLPVAIGAAMINLPAATLVAALQTVLLIAYELLTGGIGVVQLVNAIFAIWAILLVMVLIYHPVDQLAVWVSEYFGQARASLEEARTRKAALEQAMKELTEANQQLIRLQRLTQGLRQAADDARQAKERFVASVSHELRTPLNMIVGFTEMILQSPETYGKRIPKKLLADLAVIQRNAEHLRHLIDDVLDLSQIEAEQMALVKEYVPFREIIDFSITAVRPLFEQRKLALKVDMPAALPEVFCDQTRIRQVMLNLLSNAGRFTEQGEVQVRVWQESGNMMVSVSDTGPGIATDKLKTLFQPFHQLDTSIHRRYGGTGLGLAISKQFIELHEGRIWVESRMGKGTTFTFRLPIHATLDTNSPNFARWFNPYLMHEDRVPAQHRENTPLRPRFLTVDGNGALQRLLSRYMSQYEVLARATLDSALDELADFPALALLVNSESIQQTMHLLPDIHSLPKGIPIIACSLPAVQSPAAGIDAFDFLVKPIARQKLLQTLERLNLKGGRVLIVDDDPDALQLLGRFFETVPENYRVFLARDGKEAIDVMREVQPDVILLELVMPHMDGFQFLEWRNEQPDMQKIPVIITSRRDPLGEPIITSSLTITMGGGLSIRQLLSSIEMLSHLLSASASSVLEAEKIKDAG